jgi:hypothetical protein
MRVLFGMALVLALAWGAPAAGVIIASGDGTQNASPPPDDPGWNHVVELDGFTGVYVGRGWILTASHVGARDAFIGGDVYAAVPGSEIQLENPGTSPNADLLLFQIVRDPGLPDLPILSYRPASGADVVMIGHGHDRGPFVDACGSSGWRWGAGRTMRWGTNEVWQSGVDLSVSGTLTRAFTTDFSASGQTPHEAQASDGDSGGAVFTKTGIGSEWRLAGIMTSRSDSVLCQLSDAALFGHFTYAADLSYYRIQIDDVISVSACDDDLDQDGDGLVDFPDDPGCDGWDDPFETSEARPCDDGIDNDGDGRVDFDPVTFDDPGDETAVPAGEGDPGCGSPTWDTESPRCQDGIDNDGDQTLDYDGGLSALGYQAMQPDSHCDGTPHGGESPPCGLGAELALLLPPLLWLLERRG